MKKLLLNLLLLLTMAIGAVAQTEVTIGNGTYSYYELPINMYYNYSISQQIYTAEEIGMAGSISSISFYYDYSSSFNMPGIKVYMMNTDKSSFESEYDMVDLADATLVYDGNVSASGSGWVTITLDEEFDHNGTDNLLVCVYDPVYNYPGSEYTYRYTETDDYMSITYYSDSYCPNIDNLTWFEGNAYRYEYRSNIKLMIDSNVIPSCPKVNGLTVNDITSSSAVVSWLPGGSETAWVLKYGVHGFNVETEGTTEELTSPNFTINGLADNTSYDVFVKAVCGNNDESKWRRSVFRTECSAIVSFPWIENFNSYNYGPFSAYCWENVHIDGDGYYELFSIYPYSNYDNNTKQLYLPHMPNGTLTKLVLPEMMLPDDGVYKFEIDVLRNSDYNTDEGIRIFASTNGEIEGATELGFVSRDYSYTDGGVVTEESDYGWYTYAFTIPFTGTCYIILRGESQDGSETYMDNFVVREVSREAEIITCTFPTQMSEATIDSENGTIAVSVANSTDMDALVPEITISEYAEISDPTITGEGDTRTFEYTVTAEAGNQKEWTVTVTRAPVSHDAFITGFTFYGQKEGTEAVIVSEEDNYTVNAVAEWYIDLEDIVPIVTVSVAATVTPESETYQDFTTSVNYTVTAEDGETAHTYTVTIVNDPDACVNPEYIDVSNVTNNSATLSWEQAYNETSYRVKVSTEVMRDITATADVFDGIVEATTKDIEGLASGTTYYVYMQSNCENAEDWEDVMFATACNPISVLPYEEGFENSTPYYTPDCWTKVGGGSAMINDYNANTGSYCLKFAYTTGNNILVFPQLETNESSIILDFYTRPESYSNSGCGTFEVGYITDFNDISTFSAIETYSYDEWSNYQYERKIVNMSSVPAGSYFAFNHKANSSNWYWFVDDVVVRYVYNEAEIVDFDFPTRMSAPVIDSANATVAVVASYQADLDDLEEVVTVSDYATYVENTATVEGTTKTYTYTVTAEDETTTKDWTVTVTKAEAASTANDILSFTFDGQLGESIIDPEAKTVTAYAEWYIDLEDYITPEIIISPMAAITPASGYSRIFNEPVHYTVTAEDGESVADWTVTIIIDPNACVNPFYVDVYNIETTTATLRWEQSFNETSYLVKVSTTEMTDMTATADVYDGEVDLTDVTVVFDLTELTASTTYYVYVQSNCGADEWVETYFMTECDGSAHSLPFIETFDATSATRQCWNIIDGNNDYTTWYYDYDYIYGDEEVALYYYSDYNDANDWLISPKLAIVEGAYLTFEYWCDRYAEERFSVYVMDDPSNYASATQVLATQTVNSSYISVIPRINLTAYAGQEIYIGIKCESEADQEFLIIDNFKVEVITHTITLTVGEHGTVTPSGENGVVTVGDSADITFTITPDEGYQIDALIVDGNPLYCDPAGETYTFTAVTSDHTLSVTFVETVSADMIESGSLSVYPNPNNGMFSIDFSNINGDATYQLINVSGAVVETREINVMSGETMNFNHDLRSGAYFVRIINGDKVYVEQIVVE